MDQSFYIGALGAQHQLRVMGVQGDNIANINAQGYKAKKGRFSQLLYQVDNRTTDLEPVRGGVGTRLMTTTTDFSQGGPKETGLPLDHMIDGRGFFAVKDLATGEITYTRNGAFTMAQLIGGSEVTGQASVTDGYYLSDGKGRFVMDQNKRLIALATGTEEGLEKDEDGIFYVMNEDNEKVRLYEASDDLPIGMFDFEIYDGMTNIDGSRFQEIQKSGVEIPGSGRLIKKYLEASNADLADQFTKVIEAQRAYGLALKVVQTSDEVETTINNLRG